MFETQSASHLYLLIPYDCVVAASARQGTDAWITVSLFFFVVFCDLTVFSLQLLSIPCIPSAVMSVQGWVVMYHCKNSHNCPVLSAAATLWEQIF